MKCTHFLKIIIVIFFTIGGIRLLAERPPARARNAENRKVTPRNAAKAPGVLSEAELEKKLDALAGKIPFINVGDAIYHRVPYDAEYLMDDPERAAYTNFVAIADGADEARLWKLTAHPNARVRTLAILGVFWQANPKRLPGLFEFTKDAAETFPAMESFGAGGPPSTGPFEERRKGGLREQTVGDLTRRILAFHLATAKWHPVLKRITEGDPDFKTITELEFARYWDVRRNRAHCLSWFKLALLRATHGQSPRQEECLPALRNLKERVAALKPPYRGWITLALAAADDWGDDNEDGVCFASSEDIVRAGREIGTPALMRLFHWQLESDDPDLRIDDRGPFSFGGVCLLLLSHAAEIFKPEDAGEILALEDVHRARVHDDRALVSPCWAIAAADLAPARGREILLAAAKRFAGGPRSFGSSQRCKIAQAFWRLERLEGAEFVKDWFFSEKPDKGDYGHGRYIFARWLAEASCRELLQSIVLDARLDQLDSRTLSSLMVSANKSSGRKIISEEDFHEVSNPVSDSIDKIGKEETERLMPRLVKHHQATMETILGKLRATFRD